MKDREYFTKTKKETITSKIEYTRLICRCCGRKEEFRGHIELNRLDNGWTTLDINSLDNRAVYQWLLCRCCTNKVKLAAGLQVSILAEE